MSSVVYCLNNTTTKVQIYKMYEDETNEEIMIKFIGSLALIDNQEQRFNRIQIWKDQLIVYHASKINIMVFKDERRLSLQMKNTINFNENAQIFHLERIHTNYYCSASLGDFTIKISKLNSASKSLKAFKSKSMYYDEQIQDEFKVRIISTQKIIIVSYQSSIKYFVYDLEDKNSEIQRMGVINLNYYVRGLQILEVSSFNTFVILIIDDSGAVRTYYINPFSKNMIQFIKNIQIGLVKSKEIRIVKLKKTIYCIDNFCRICFFSLKVN